MAEFLRRSSGQSVGKPVEPDQSCPLASRYPALDEFLVLTEWEDGARRETGTVLLCTGDGRWRAWLNDRDGSRSAWLSADTLTGLLDALEEGVRTGRLEWRSTKVRQKK